MSAEIASFQTKIIITPSEGVYNGRIDRLPEHLDVVHPFRSTVEQADVLAYELTSPLKRYEFGITNLETKSQRSILLQRIGGSALHEVHDRIIEELDEIGIKHSNHKWREGTTQTWYRGTWEVPERVTAINGILLVQRIPEKESSWRLVRDKYTMVKPDTDFRQDLHTERYRELLNSKKSTS